MVTCARARVHARGRVLFPPRRAALRGPPQRRSDDINGHPRIMRIRKNMGAGHGFASYVGVGHADATVARESRRAGKAVVLAALSQRVLRVDGGPTGAPQDGPHVTEGRHAAAAGVEEVGGLQGSPRAEKAGGCGEGGHSGRLGLGLVRGEVHEGLLDRALDGVGDGRRAGERVCRRERGAGGEREGLRLPAGVDRVEEAEVGKLVGEFLQVWVGRRNVSS
mmetsp:Transcript_82898/g.222360  ORF Transcript_82898/g.222360 Transcript_82898/m.222360 type:complete len:221 (-) Transcript_82898:728-1390(-)